MKKLLTFLKWTAILVFVVIVGFLVAIQFFWRRTFDAPYPDLHATTDSAMIAQGRYLAFGPAHCAECHGPGDLMTEMIETNGKFEGYPPLSGGFEYTFELGTLHFPNITPDSTTGIGRYSDPEIARMLRHTVRPNGEATIPIMEYQNISDEDVVAILSFLRSQEPVYNEVPDNEYSFMGKMVKLLMAKPTAPNGDPPLKSPPEAVTIERGEYLANRMAQCAQCHTTRDPVDFSLNGPRLAGGAELHEPWVPDVTFRPPNLTPDPETGHITNWTEEQFVNRFKAGPVFKGTPMPWNPFSNMSETDIKAIYKYLHSLDPVHNETGPTMSKNDADKG